MDYFKQLITRAKDFEDVDGVVTQFCNDVNSYREFSIRQYNNNSERGIDKFCLQMFLNNYNIAINVFGLHSNMKHRKIFNRLLNVGWELYNDKYEDHIPDYCIIDCALCDDIDCPSYKNFHNIIT